MTPRRPLSLLTLAAVVSVFGCGGGGGGGGGGSGVGPLPTAVGATFTPAPSATPGEPTPNATAASNVQPIAVNAGPTNQYTNGLFTSVTICVPGDDSHCQTIGGILVDTGSSGLRILASALALSLPQQMSAGNEPVAECVQFLDSFTWGPVQLADVTLSGERASALPIQVIGDARFPVIPTPCTSSGMPAADTVDTLSANGILGVGVFRQDCGISCQATGAANPGLYYTCSSAGCEEAAEPLADQVQNPVWTFPEDNNGIVIELPAIPASGADGVNGALVLGIGTQANNALAGESVVTLEANGTFSTVFRGQPVSSSFFDSGSNAIFFLDPLTTGIPSCADDHDFYCPQATETLSATLRGAGGEMSAATFSVDNADTLFAGNASALAFSDLAGPSSGMFDWGLPFFFGRRIFTAIEGQRTPVGVGPYVAY